jgi:hypothetical protein
MRRFLIPLVLGVILLAVPGAARADYFFVAMLSGANEVPPTDTDGEGIALVILNDAGDTLTVDVYWDDLTGPAMAAHIHIGAADVPGPVVIPFSGFPSAVGGHFSNQYTAADVTGGVTFDDVIAALFAGNTYVNIHTARYPGGEIRGQNQ